MTTRHWGDIPVISDADSGIVALEREQLIKPRPLEIEDPMLYSQYQRIGVEGDTLGPRLTKGSVTGTEQFDADPITLHTIQLVQHSRKMKSLIQQAQQQVRDISKNDKTEPNLASPIPVPEYPESGKLKQQRIKPWSFQRPICKTDFNSGIGGEFPPLDSVDCRRLSRQSIATICAHVGFDTCKESTLELLVDITCEYYQRLTKHLRTTVDSQLIWGDSGFPDVVEQVFRECGVGSVRDLEDFYNNRILRYHELTLNHCQQLVQDYEKLQQTNKSPSPDKATPTSSEVKVKEEKDTEVEITVASVDEDEKKDSEEEMEGFHMESLGPMDMSLDQETATNIVPDLEYKEPAGMSEEQGIVKTISLDTDDEEIDFKEEIS